jgi:hypothetical protein
MTTKPKTAAPTDITSTDFETIFREWLLARSNNGDDEETDEQQEARCSREEDLAQRILAMHAGTECLVFRKFEVADYYITKHGEATWTETLALTALDGIKADILRLGAAREEHRRDAASSG